MRTVINGMRPASHAVAARVLGHPGGSETFGYRSVAGIVTVPFTSVPGKFGTWNVYGGVEYQRLGDRDLCAWPENQVIYSIGIGFSY